MNPPENEGRRVLAVDLDGTLLKGDLLWESLLAHVLPAPWRIGAVVAWCGKGGRAGLKAKLAERTAVDGALLPWNREVVEFCEARSAEGWTIVLATASNEKAARAVTSHFPFIARVIGSDASVNLKSERKAERLVAEFGPDGFDYVGDSAADLPVWKVARAAWFVGRAGKGQSFERGLGKPLGCISTQAGFSFRGLFAAMRPHQWLKNLLVFFPVLMAHRWTDYACWRQVGPVFLALCCMASASYLLNDLSDLDADRRHPRKKSRPFASGELALQAGLLSILILLSLGLALASLSGGAALAATAAYFLFTALYSLGLKTIPVLDAVFLSALYTYRMVLGGIAGSVMISAWLLAFSTTFFLGLAFLKRYVELDALPEDGAGRLARRGYARGDLGFVQMTGVSSGFLSVVVLALYLDSAASSALYATPHWLWGIAFVLLLWIMRVWFLAGRKQLHDDPVWFAAKDPVTLGLAVVCVAVVAAAGPLR